MVLPLRLRVDVGVKANKGYSILPRADENGISNQRQKIQKPFIIIIFKQ